MSRFLRLIAIAGVLVAPLALGATAANAQSSSISPAFTDTGVCGSGYHQIDHHALTDATIYLDYNGSQNCVVTIKTRNVGIPTYTEAWLFRQSDGSGGDDHGNFSYYAGPVSVPAPGTCVRWGGADDTLNGWDSGWSHCG
jgi:hypothetical protein